MTVFIISRNPRIHKFQLRSFVFTGLLGSVTLLDSRQSSRSKRKNGNPEQTDKRNDRDKPMPRTARKRKLENSDQTDCTDGKRKKGAPLKPQPDCVLKHLKSEFKFIQPF